MKYRVLLHWDDFREYPPIEGDIDTQDCTVEEVLNRILVQGRGECDKMGIPPVSELDVIELEDGRRFRVLDEGFNELCSRPEDRYCQICSRFYLRRECVPKAVHFNVKNTFYERSRNNLCGKCFKEYGVKMRG